MEGVGPAGYDKVETGVETWPDAETKTARVKHNGLMGLLTDAPASSQAAITQLAVMRANNQRT